MPYVHVLNQVVATRTPFEFSRNQRGVAVELDMQRDLPARTSLPRTTYLRASFAIPWCNRLIRNALRDVDPAEARGYTARLAGVSLSRVLATSCETDVIR